MPQSGSESAKQILDHLAHAVLLFGADLRLRYLNPAGEVLIGLSAPKARGQPAGALFDPPFEASLKQVLQSGTPRIERYRTFVVNGRTKLVHSSFTPVPEGDGIEGVVVELEEVVGLCDLEEDFRQQWQQTLLFQLLKGLAHEIKNPLGGLRGAAQLLAQELDSEELGAYTDLILQEADRLRDLVDRFLLLDRKGERERLNIHAVLERVRAILSAEFPGIELRRDYDPSLPELEGDRNQLIQLFLNLGRNAAQAVEGEGQVVLRTRVARRIPLCGRHHLLALRADVIDNGPGIPPERQAEIFYPLVTYRPGGSGLGLALAQAIATRHGGKIELTSKPGETRFSVYLPLARHENWVG